MPSSGARRSPGRAQEASRRTDTLARKTPAAQALVPVPPSSETVARGQETEHDAPRHTALLFRPQIPEFGAAEERVTRSADSPKLDERSVASNSSGPPDRDAVVAACEEMGFAPCRGPVPPVHVRYDGSTRCRCRLSDDRAAIVLDPRCRALWARVASKLSSNPRIYSLRAAHLFPGVRLFFHFGARSASRSRLLSASPPDWLSG